MFNQDKQFRRPDGTLYDPSSFNVRHYEEQYGPGAKRRRWLRQQQTEAAG